MGLQTFRSGGKCGLMRETIHLSAFLERIPGYPPRVMPTIVSSIIRFYQSSIGRKLAVAVTGLLLIGFLVVHMLGNFLLYAGPEALNAYAKKLHDLGPLLWVARLGLLGLAVVHVVGTIQLTRENRVARSQKYAVDATRKATKSSRTMILSGLTILAFIGYHLMHFTVCWGNDYGNPENKRYWLADGSKNVYNMVVDGFGFLPASAFYIVAMGLLFMHLSHGFASVFQTLGVTTPKSRPVIEGAGKLLALGLFLGNISMPLAVLLGFVK
jgi:succinate dehydrogenase / fumarate reductase cytochrome b subunit